jgi:glyoxylase-like metal-dependent hydrolase (beta-lactamase superfamily II)
MPAKACTMCSIQVGDIRVTYLPDGEGAISPTITFPGSADSLWAAHKEFVDADGKWVASLGGFLVETGDRKVLIDLGFGDMHVPVEMLEGYFRGGRFLDSLKQTGVSPDQIDTVAFTHLHLDHVGWVSTGGALTFPNAAHVAGRGEWDFWRGVPDEQIAALMGPNPSAVQAPLENRIEALEDGASVAPGITTLATPGHTPGHVSFAISSGTDRALILGDVIHCPLQFDEGDLSVLFDIDQAVARRTRERIAAELEGTSTVAADGHFSDAVFGRLVAGQGKRWVAVP